MGSRRAVGYRRSREWKVSDGRGRFCLKGGAVRGIASRRCLRCRGSCLHTPMRCVAGCPREGPGSRVRAEWRDIMLCCYSNVRSACCLASHTATVHGAGPGHYGLAIRLYISYVGRSHAGRARSIITLNLPPDNGGPFSDSVRNLPLPSATSRRPRLRHSTLHHLHHLVLAPRNPTRRTMQAEIVVRKIALELELSFQVQSRSPAAVFRTPCWTIVATSAVVIQ